MTSCRHPTMPPAHAFHASGAMSRTGFLAMRAWQKFGSPGTSPHSPGSHDQSDPASPSGSSRSMAASRTRPSDAASTPPSALDILDGLDAQRAHARRSAHTAGISIQRLRVTVLHPPTVHGPSLRFGRVPRKRILVGQLPRNLTESDTQHCCSGARTTALFCGHGDTSKSRAPLRCGGRAVIEQGPVHTARRGASAR